jgi:hypothetical protein
MTTLARRRFWVSAYNIPRKFDNGTRWVRVSIRLRGWHRLGGLWWSRHWPFFKVLLPQGPKRPIQEESNASV